METEAQEYPMKTGQNHLFIPGPTNVPEDVRRAMNVPMQDMRAPDFGDLTLSLFIQNKTQIPHLHQTNHEVWNMIKSMKS